MKKIVFLRSNPVMPDPRVEKEIMSLKKAGYSTEIIAWDREGNLNQKEKEIGTSKVKITFIKAISSYGSGFKKNLIPLLKFQYGLLKNLYLKRDDYNVIHACDFDTVIPAFLISKIFRKKYVYDIFDYYVDAYSVPRNFKTLIKKLDNYMINNSNCTIICTEKRVEQIVGANPQKLEIIHNSPMEYTYEKNISKDKNILKISYIGILAKERMIEELLEIVASDRKYELHIGGFGLLEKKVEDYSNKYENIIFYGRTSYLKTMEIESMCDVMTALYDPRNKNHYYAAPNKFYEGLMLGKPLIMVENTGMANIVKKLKCGEVIEFSKKSLKEGLDNLIERQEAFCKIGNSMKLEYHKFYSWAIMEKRLIKIYEEV